MCVSRRDNICRDKIRSDDLVSRATRLISYLIFCRDSSRQAFPRTTPQARLWLSPLLVAITGSVRQQTADPALAHIDSTRRDLHAISIFTTVEIARRFSKHARAVRVYTPDFSCSFACGCRRLRRRSRRRARRPSAPPRRTRSNRCSQLKAASQARARRPRHAHPIGRSSDATPGRWCARSPAR